MKKTIYALLTLLLLVGTSRACGGVSAGYSFGYGSFAVPFQPTFTVTYLQPTFAVPTYTAPTFTPTYTAPVVVESPVFAAPTYSSVGYGFGYGGGFYGNGFARSRFFGGSRVIVVRGRHR